MPIRLVSALSWRLSFLLSIAALLSVQTAQAQDKPEPRRPNVILVMTDDQGYGDLSCHGNPWLKTPHLDSLHAESVRLTNFHVDPTCSPTRSALMTGRYSGRVGVWHTIMGRSLLPAKEVTMAEVFADAGYATGIFGKWHLGDNRPMRAQDQGFTTTFVHGGGGVGQMPDVWGNDYFDDTYLRNGVPEAQNGYCTDVWFDGALRFIEQNRNQPFFCYIPTNAPHGPYRVGEQYSQTFAGNKEVPNANFYGMILNIDENVGRLLAKLKEWDLEDNTIVIFMTDNGSAAAMERGKGYNAGMKGLKGSPYEGGHRVPCFIRYPQGGLTGGRDVKTLAAHFDLLPTLAELTGADLPKSVELDGRSLAPLLKESDSNWPERTLIVESQRIEMPEKWRQSAVMTDRWRLVNRTELYDIQADPGQKTNIAAEHPNVVAGLQAAYESWWQDAHGNDDKKLARIELGGEVSVEQELTAHDWHGDRVPWDQNHTRSGFIGNGDWAVEVVQPGRYRIDLARWPDRAEKQIQSGPGIIPVKAKLEIGEYSNEQNVAKDATSVSFFLDLKAGPTRMRGTFTDAEGKTCGTYYAVVERLPD
jgi:arylsulfatase A-like enzyme